MSVENLKRCSNCKCTLSVSDNFEKNRKGELFKTCNGCRSKGRTNKKVCDRCGKEYRVDTGIQAHQKSWGCVESTWNAGGSDEDFYKWILENRNHLKLGLDAWVPFCEKYFMQREDKR